VTTRPHDLTDLHLAPVAITLDSRLNDLCATPSDQLAGLVELRTTQRPESHDERRDAMLKTITHAMDTRGWTASWHERGLAISHAQHSLVLGIPANIKAYLES
jgi:hypothetical protein